MAEKTNTPTKPAEARLRRREPLDMFDTLRDEMERFWGQFWPMPLPRPERPKALAAGTWVPRMDVFEKNGNLVVKAELPGVDKQDLQVSLDRGDLEIRGEQKTESEVKEENYYRMERSHGSFYRRLPLPFEVAPDQITAAFTDGVLEVTIPRPAEKQPPAQAIKVV